MKPKSHFHLQNNYHFLIYIQIIILDVSSEILFKIMFSQTLGQVWVLGQMKIKMQMNVQLFCSPNCTHLIDCSQLISRPFLDQLNICLFIILFLIIFISIFTLFQQKPSRQTLFDCLRSNLHLKCLVLTFLILSGIVTILWCKIGQITRFILNFQVSLFCFPYYYNNDNPDRDE